MNEWQPIETAPRDGTAIIVSGWHDGLGMTRMIAAAAQWRDEVWRRDNNGYGYAVSCYPTHWMPLPEPPDGPSA